MIMILFSSIYISILNYKVLILGHSFLIATLKEKIFGLLAPKMGFLRTQTIPPY